MCPTGSTNSNSDAEIGGSSTATTTTAEAVQASTTTMTASNPSNSNDSTAPGASTASPDVDNSKKATKRQADRQITKDDGDDDDDDDDENGDKDSSQNANSAAPFARASAEVLATRRIVKVKRPGSSTAESNAAKSNPFASTTLLSDVKDSSSSSNNNSSSNSNNATSAAPSKIFGSSTGFSGFKAAAAATTTSAFGFGASTTASNSNSTSTSTPGFGSPPAASGIFGSAFTSSANVTDSASATPSSTGFQTTFATKAESDTSQGDASSSLFFFNKNSTTAPTFSFGKKPSSEGSPGSALSSATPAVATAAPPLVLPDQVNLSTGEEDEINIHESRCKSFQWVVVEKEITPEAKSSDSTSPVDSATASSDTLETTAIPSVKPSESFQIKNSPAGKQKTDKENGDVDTDADTNQENGETAATTTEASLASTNKPPSSQIAATTTSASSTNPQYRWKELGTGPMKLLQSQRDPERVRLVQRRESTPNGNATKVILNLHVWKESRAQLKNKGQENYLSFTTLDENGDTSTYLWKFKQVHEARMFLAHLQDVLPVAKSCFTKK